MNEDTKAHWRRKALRAEAELETIRQIRMFDTKREIQMHRQLSAAMVALREIQMLIDEVKELSDEPRNP